LKYNMVQKLRKPDSLYLLKAYLSDDDPSIEFIDERLGDLENVLDKT